MSVQYKGRFQWDWRERHADVAINASVPWDVEIVGGSNKLQGKLTSVELRSFELTGGASQLRLMLGSTDRDRPDPPDRRSQQRAIRTSDGGPRPVEAVGWRGGVSFDGQKLGSTAGHNILETSGAAEASDRFVIEVTGGASRITVVEAGG